MGGLFDLTQPDPSRPPVWLRRGRRRPKAAERWLIDSRLLNGLCSSGQGTPAENFRASLTQLFPRPGNGLPPLELTPLGFLDAIGVEPPSIDPFPLPPSVLKSGESVMATTLVVKLVEEKYRESEALKPEALRKSAEEMRAAIDPAAVELFDLCAGRFLADEKFEDSIIRQLSFDFVVRFPFPEVLREEVFEFLCASLFAAWETVSGLSKVRIIKTLWERAYPWLLKANPKVREEIQALDREIRPRTRNDFLAWELVHHAVLGYGGEENMQTVIGLVPEPTERTKARCIIYKSALRSFLDQISRDDLVKIRPKLDLWRPGTLVPCGEDGICESPVLTGELPVFLSQRTSGG